jgi:hypothetical protein
MDAHANITSVPVQPTSLIKSPAMFWAVVLAIPIFAIWWWVDYRWRIAEGEPPLVPFKIPWLGHGLDFMNDINGFAEWVRYV